MKTALFHYNLKPGSITDIIVESCRAVLSQMEFIQEIRLVCGEEEGTAAVLERIRSGFSPDKAGKVRMDVLTEIAGSGQNTASDTPKNIADRLEARYGEDTLWWIHNYHLGSNPNFTQALMQTARSGSRNMLFHIHDFPECARLDKLAGLDSVLDEAPYPSGPRVRYAVGNERDYRILSESGLGESVTLLPAPVSLSAVPDPAPEPDEMSLRAALDECCAADNPGYIPGAPLLFYPVKAARRRNILEAALFCRLLENPANLLISMPAESQKEKSYSDTVRQGFRSGLIPGIWCPEASGDPRLSTASLAASCNAVISTSVLENSSELFINALHWQKPLLARYLDILDGVLELFGDYPRRFWADFSVPVDSETAQRTKEAYQQKISVIEKRFPAKAVKSITSAVSKMHSSGSIDFSFLSVKDQLAVLELARGDQNWIDNTRSLNKELLESAARTLFAYAPSMDRKIESYFSSSAYAHNFNSILKDFGVKRSAPSAEKISESVLKAFGRIDYMRLLFDD